MTIRSFGVLALPILAGLWLSPCSSSDVLVNVAGNGIAGFSGDGGAATSAKINVPALLAQDASGNLYFTEYSGNRIRRVDATTGTISTVAGTGVAGFSGDGGPAINAQFNNPVGIAIDSAGTIYISDQGNNRVRKISSTGVITTIAGTGVAGFTGDGGPALSAQIQSPSGLALDPVDGAVIVSQINSSCIRRIDLTTSKISTIVGTGTDGFSGDGGLATAAKIAAPGKVAFDSGNNLTFADGTNSRIRRVARTTGIISTIAGTGTIGFSGDNGPATAAAFAFRSGNSVNGGIAIDSKDNIFVNDGYNYRIRFIAKATGTITTIAGTGTAGYDGNFVDAATSRLGLVAAILPEANGNYLISEFDNNLVRRVVRNSQSQAFAVSRVIPSQGGNTGPASPTILGSGFVNGATVVLKLSGFPDIAASAVQNRYGIGLHAEFDLNGAAVGVYDILVTLPSGDFRTLKQGYTIVAGDDPKFNVDIVGNDKIRGGKEQAYLVVCNNIGTNDQYAIPLIVTFPSYLQFKPGFTLIHPTSQPAGVPPVDYSKISLLAAGKDVSQVRLLIPVLPTGATRAYALRFTVPDTFAFAHVHFKIDAQIGQPLLSPSAVKVALASRKSGRNVRPLGELSNDCQRNLLNTIFACAGIFLPGLSCAESVVSFAVQTELDLVLLVNDPTATKDDAVGNLADILSGAGQAGFSCLEKSIPVLGQVLNTASCLTGIYKANECSKGDNSASKDAESVVSGDPNDKSGPSGAGDAHYIALGTPMSYYVQFENKLDATAAAQTVVITDVLDTTTLDSSTLSLGVITFADQVITPPPGLSSFTTDVDLRPAKNLIVRITAGLQGATLTWKFDSLDPATMLTTADPVLGFLDPNKTPPQGEGAILFTVKQKANLPVGAVIKNKATIVFDTNSPIDTPVWSNTIALLGADTDNDGYPDELEIAAGSNPADANSTPLGGGKAVLQDLNVTKLTLKLDFSSKQKDALQISGELPNVPSTFKVKDQTVQIYFGGVYRKFALDSTGSSPKSKTESIAIKSGKSGYTFTAKINAPMASYFVDEDLTAATTLKASKTANRYVQAYVLFSNFLYKQKVPVSFSSKMGASGQGALAK